MIRSSRLARACVFAMFAAVGAACSGGTGQEGRESPIPNPVDPSTAAALRGTVRFEGTPALAQPVRMTSDPNCAAFTDSEQAIGVGDNGALQNVFVYVREGLGELRFPVPDAPVVLDQKGCMYRPRVLGIQVGQTLEILNSDMTLHNVHALSQTNREFNRGQPLQGIRDRHVFTAREVMVPFKCDVHSWMQAWVGVLDHPYYDVTAADGTFALKNLPPGTYTIEAWHEKLGRSTQMVMLGANESKEIALTLVSG